MGHIHRGGGRFVTVLPRGGRRTRRSAPGCRITGQGGPKRTARPAPGPAIPTRSGPPARCRGHPPRGTAWCGCTTAASSSATPPPAPGRSRRACMRSARTWPGGYPPRSPCNHWTSRVGSTSRASEARSPATVQLPAGITSTSRLARSRGPSPSGASSWTPRPGHAALVQVVRARSSAGARRSSSSISTDTRSQEGQVRDGPAVTSATGVRFTTCAHTCRARVLLTCRG